MSVRLISSKELCRTPIFWVTVDHAVDPAGFEIRRAIVQHRGSAVMMPVNARGQVLLVRQYRLPARDYLWELPAGRMDPGETALQAAKRELIEETGYRAKKWKRLSSFYNSPGFVAEKMHLFVAQELAAGVSEPMEDERIEIRWFSLKEIGAMIESGKIIDAKTIIGWALWKEMKKRR